MSKSPEKTSHDNNLNNPPGETELMELKRIDETSTKLQRQGKYLEALEYMERGLILRQHFFGSHSSQLQNACQIVGNLCNLLAVTYLQQSDYELVRELLQKAEILTEQNPKGRAVTCNNWACFYRRRGKLRMALRYLQEAIRIESTGGGGEGEEKEFENRADTYLNACAVLSQLGKHGAALDHAQSALILLQEELFQRYSHGSPPPRKKATKKHDGGGIAQSDGNEDEVKENQDNEEETISVRLDRIAVLAIAYHNIGVEQEFLKQFQNSLTSHRKGMEIAMRYLGEDHSMSITLKNACLMAQRAIVTAKTNAKNRATRSL